jgi:hypothetical protein
MITEKKIRYFLKNNYAVLGLPLRLTVSLILGTLVLFAILSYILNPCLFPHQIIVSVTPQVTVVNGSDPQNVSFIVFVNETNGHPLNNASILIKGLGGAAAGFSDKTGRSIITLQVQLEQGLCEGYLDIIVKAPCHVPFECQAIAKVVKNTPSK